MDGENNLNQKREELKSQLDSGKYKTLTGISLDKTGRIIQQITRGSEPPSYWYSAVVVVLILALIGNLIKILLGETYEINPRFGSVENELLFTISVWGLIMGALIAAKTASDIFFTTLSNHLVDAIVSVADLADIHYWLVSRFCNVKTQLSMSLVLGMLMGAYSVIFFSMIRGGFIGLGGTIAGVIAVILTGMAVLQFLAFFSLPARLGRYQYKLYAADPSSSEIVDHLSDMLANIVYIFAFVAAIFTLVFGYFGLLNLASTIPLVLLAWGPLTIFFITSQVALRKIITRAKWNKLNEIQANIEALEVEENITDEKIREAVNWLMDYHNQIKGTPNSALDIRASLNFLNSLLLPAIALLLANLDEVLKFFQAR